MSEWKFKTMPGGELALVLMLQIVCTSLCLVQGNASGMVDSATPLGVGPRGATLVFSDEFNGPELSRTRWNIGINSKNTLHGMLHSTYRAENIHFQDGKMVFTARHHPQGVEGQISDDAKTYNYSSGAVNAGEKFYLRQNMYVEARVKLPTNKGGYCVFSAMPNRAKNTSFKDPRERLQIHFFEYVASEEQRMFASLIWFNDYLEREIPSHLKDSEYMKVSNNHYLITSDMKRARWIGSNTPLPVLDWYEWYEWNDFVTVGFMATPSQFDWFIVEQGPVLDFPPYMSFKGGQVSPPVYSYVNKLSQHDVWQREVPEHLENSLVLDFSLREVEWAGGPIDEEQLPSQMLIDYIRVYQLD